jgi:hypothetical protein
MKLIRPFRRETFTSALRFLPTSILAAVLFAGGCSGDGEGSRAGEWEAVYDSIGDTLVVRTVSGSVWGDAARLIPEVSIGMFDGPEEYLFGQIVSLARGPDGSIYVMDQHVPALRVYNPDGTYRATFGRQGEGPGEYKRPDGGLNVLSDGRVLLRDPANARIQVYSSEGEPLETWRIRGNFNTSQRMIVDRRDRAHAMILLDPEADVREWTTGLVQILPDGTPGDTLEIPDTPWEPAQIVVSRENEGGGRSMSVNSVPFSPRETAVLSPEGYFIHAISTEYALTLLRPQGPLRIEKAFTPVQVASGERAEEEAFATRNMRYTDPNWRWNGPAIPSVKPPFRSIHPGEDGTVWVQTSQPGVKREDPDYDPADPRALPDEWREPVAFDVFDKEGRYLGPVRTPEGFSTYPAPVFTRDWVLATVRDAYDVQTVVKFRVVVERPDSP